MSIFDFGLFVSRSLWRPATGVRTSRTRQTERRCLRLPKDSNRRRRPLAHFIGFIIELKEASLFCFIQTMSLNSACFCKFCKARKGPFSFSYFSLTFILKWDFLFPPLLLRFTFDFLLHIVFGNKCACFLLNVCSSWWRIQTHIHPIKTRITWILS